MVSQPINEIARLKALRDLALLDTEAEESFDELTRSAALMCGVPIALVSLIDADRQWFKSKVGLQADETARELAFCAHAILRPNELLEVADASQDPRFSANPLVTGEPGIRFYAGAPLVDQAGLALGTLCVIDRRPRVLEPWQREVLGHLARQVVRMFVARAAAHRLIAPAPTESAERRRIEESLYLEQERFRAMNDASPIGIFVTDVQGRATYLNDRWCSLTGITIHDGLGDGWSATLHPADRERVFGIWSEAVAQGKTFDAEYRFLHGDGSLIWCHGMAAPMRIAGQVVGYVGSINDITERHAAEERLRDSLRRFDLVTAGAAIGIWETRFDPLRWREQVTNELPFYWSRRFIEIMGYTADEFPDRLEPWLIALHPEDRERTLAAVMDCLGNGVPYNVEYRLRHRSGDYRWYHATGEAERDAQGRPQRMAGSMSDIDMRKRDEQLLEIAQAQVIDAIANIDAGFAMFAANGRLVVSNPQFQTLFTLDPRDVLPGTPYRDILAAKVRCGALQDVGGDAATWIAARLAAHVQPGEAQEYRLAGRWIRIADRRTADGGIVSLHTDVTVLREAAEEMRKARDLAEGAGRAKADFLATMSHELRTPMNGVIGMSSLLLDTPLNEQQREFAETVRLCGDQLLALINDILDFSKIEAGSLMLERIPFSPRRLAEDCVALFADQAERKGLELICLIAADVPTRLLGDPTRLRQVVLNLLGNAVKFTKRGEVVLSLTSAGVVAGRPQLAIAVRDTGIGIPPQARERLFKPFSQADSSTTRKYGGTGLGLVICQRLVHLMEGGIELDSHIGQGTTFTCRMPLDLAPDAEVEDQHAGLVGRRALVVGPSAAARRALREQFIGWGMSCDEAPDAAAATSAALNRPALVVLDHDQAVGGMALAGQLGSEAGLQGIPFVLLVGAAHRGLASAAKEAGIAGLLIKPVRHQQLFDCLLVVFEQACRLQDRPQGAAPELVTRHSLDEQRELRRVLVVEDNPVNRQVAVMMLAKLGCRCDIATNGQEAVDALSRQDYQLVFMDCQMPVMDGYAATSAIRRREGDQRRTRIVALTANAMAGDRERCLAAGMDDYVTKPIKASDLEAAITRADQRSSKQSSTQVVALAPQAEAIIDDEALCALVAATDVETLCAVAEMMRVDASAALIELRAAVVARDAVTIGRIAHRLKGSAGTIGLRRVQTLCQHLEHGGRTKKLDEAGSLLTALEQAVHEALPALAAHPLVTGQ